MPLTGCSVSRVFRFQDAGKVERANVLASAVPAAAAGKGVAAVAAVADANIIYTDVWASMGQEEEEEKRKQDFADFQVNADLLSRAPSDCRFMHDLPAKRGLEVTDDAMESPNSIVFHQAENRMHLAKGLLTWIVTKAH